MHSMERLGLKMRMRGAMKAAAVAAAMALTAIAISAMPAVAQDKPDFSGSWNLNADKSDFGAVPGPTQETITITQKTPAISEAVSYTDDQGTHSYTLDLTIDGPEVTFSADKAPQLGMVTLQKAKIAWQGTSLFMNESLKYEADADVVGTNTYTLAADGKTLTMAMTFTTPMGEMERKLVFDRAGDKAGAGGAMTSSGSGSMSGAGASAASGASASAGGSGSMAMPSSAGAAGPAPNLSGTWKLNASKSDFGQIPVPDSRTEKITDAEPSIKIVSTWTGGAMGDGSNTMDLDTTGKETSTQIMGNDAKSTAKWDGTSLVVNTTMQMQDADVAVRSTYNLSADGKTLTVLSHVSSPMGEIDMKAVFDKQ
jgi:hypothetical protein